MMMDSLIVQAPEYPAVKDTYVDIILAPFRMEYKFITNNLNNAIELAHKAFKNNPNHLVSRHAISSIYHEQAMSALRKNKLKEARRILSEGLKLVPDDKVLNEDLSQIPD